MKKILLQHEDVEEGRLRMRAVFVNNTEESKERFYSWVRRTLYTNETLFRVTFDKLFQSGRVEKAEKLYNYITKSITPARAVLYLMSRVALVMGVLGGLLYLIHLAHYVINNIM